MPTVITMRVEDATRFCEVLESDGYVTETVDAVDLNTGHTKMMVLRTPQREYEEGEPGKWEIWTDTGWWTFSEPRRRFDPLTR